MTLGTALTAFAPDLFVGRHVLITGGTSGIGKAIAEGFARLGAEIVVTGVSAVEVDRARSSQGSRTIQYRILDVRDPDDVAGIISSHRQLDILINCAGIIRRHEELNAEVFADVVDVNLTGTMRLCAAALPLLSKSRGSIVNIASMLSYFGSGVAPGYAASKGGISQLTKSLAIAYAQQGIRVNAIAPGWIETPLTADIKDTPQYKAIQGRTAQKAWGRPDDVVGAVLFLCSPAADYITAATLPVDGGYLAV